MRRAPASAAIATPPASPARRPKPDPCRATEPAPRPAAGSNTAVTGDAVLHPLIWPGAACPDKCATPSRDVRPGAHLGGRVDAYALFSMTDDEIEAMFTPKPPCSQLLGWRLLEHDETRGWIKVGFDGKAEFLNPAGRVQGGILTAMLDDTMGPAVLVKSGGALYPSTIDMNISFLPPRSPGRWRARAKYSGSARAWASSPAS